MRLDLHEKLKTMFVFSKENEKMKIIQFFSVVKKLNFIVFCEL